MTVEESISYYALISVTKKSSKTEADRTSEVAGRSVKFSVRNSKCCFWQQIVRKYEILYVDCNGDTAK